jgi:hypothetical protein
MPAPSAGVQPADCTFAAVDHLTILQVAGIGMAVPMLCNLPHGSRLEERWALANVEVFEAVREAACERDLVHALKMVLQLPALLLRQAHHGGRRSTAAVAGRFGQWEARAYLELVGDWECACAAHTTCDV